MIANHVHDALNQVHKLQELVLARRRFQGYSGKARVLSGTTALLGAMLMTMSRVPQSPFAHLIGWGVVLGIGIIINYGCLGYWFLFNAHVRRNPRMLKPAVDALPALGAGGALTLALILHGYYDLLPGIWMVFYGLAQVAYRQSLPSGIYAVGVGYILAGTIYLLLPGTTFTNPCPMGFVFLTGEWVGGVILYMNNDHSISDDEMKDGSDSP